MPETASFRGAYLGPFFRDYLNFPDFLIRDKEDNWFFLIFDYFLPRQAIVT
jgi:hypothetical protein